MIYIVKIDVRFADIDAMGHVNNAVYLSYLEHARLKFFDKYFSEINWKEKALILAKVELNYIRPILLHDTIVVEMNSSRMGKKSFDLSYKIFKIENTRKTEMANAITVLVGYDYKNHSTISIPEEWKRKLK